MQIALCEQSFVPYFQIEILLLISCVLYIHYYTLIDWVWG